MSGKCQQEQMLFSGRVENFVEQWFGTTVFGAVIAYHVAASGECTEKFDLLVHTVSRLACCLRFSRRLGSG